ncbi:MAG: Gfo/Idh/MocA family oxidoreductase [Thermoguttaceae bacterium]
MAKYAAGTYFAVPYIIPSSVLGQNGTVAPSERIVCGVIGCGAQGRKNLVDFLQFPQVQMLSVCDPITTHRESACGIVDKHYGKYGCIPFEDYRELLATDNIDAVIIAAPDHWHAKLAVSACRAGKDVFCEKPESLTVRESREIVERARQFSCVFSGGARGIIENFSDLARLVRGDYIGDVTDIYVTTGEFPKMYDLPEMRIPKEVNWELWTGPAPMRPFNEVLIKSGFRPYREFSGGEFAFRGAEQFGAISYVLGKPLTHVAEKAVSGDTTQATSSANQSSDVTGSSADIANKPTGNKDKPDLITIRPANISDTGNLFYIFPNGMKIHGVPELAILQAKSTKVIDKKPFSAKKSVIFKGTAGELPNGKYVLPDKHVELPVYRCSEQIVNSGLGVIGDFLECVKTRQKPFRDVETVHDVMTMVHLGDIANQLQRELQWNIGREEFENDEIANRYLSRFARPFFLTE